MLWRDILICFNRGIRGGVLDKIKKIWWLTEVLRVRACVRAIKKNKKNRGRTEVE